MSQVYSYYVKALLEHADKLGIDSGAILNSHEFEPDLLDRYTLVDAAIYNDLVRKLWLETDDEWMGFAVNRLKRGVFYAGTKLALHADTLESGLRELFQMFHLTTDDLKVEFTRDEFTGNIAFLINTEDKDPRHFLTDFMVCVFHRFSSWLIGCQIPISQLKLPFPKPDAIPDYKRIFDSPLVFENTRVEIIFPAKFLSFRIIRNLAELRDFIKNSPRDLVDLPSVKISSENQLKALIASLSGETLVLPPFERLAEKMNISAQTLRRRLGEDGTSYRNIKDILRRDYCIEKLTRTSLPVAEIAAQVGFSEPAVLSRAFSNWTGMSPSDYRDKHSHK